MAIRTLGVAVLLVVSTPCRAEEAVDLFGAHHTNMDTHDRRQREGLMLACVINPLPRTGP